MVEEFEILKLHIEGFGNEIQLDYCEVVKHFWSVRQSNNRCDEWHI